MSEQLKQCLVCNSQDVEICSIDDEGIYYEWCCNNCDTSIRGDNPGFLYIGHVTEAKKLLDKSRNELAALTAERDKLKAENEELKTKAIIILAIIKGLEKKLAATEAELTAAVKLLGMYCFKGYISLDCDKCFTQSRGACCPDKIRAALKTVVEKGKEDNEK